MVTGTVPTTPTGRIQRERSHWSESAPRRQRRPYLRPWQPRRLFARLRILHACPDRRGHLARRLSDSFWNGTRGTSTWMSIRSSSGPDRRFWYLLTNPGLSCRRATDRRNNHTDTRAGFCSGIERTYQALDSARRPCEQCNASLEGHNPRRRGREVGASSDVRGVHES